MSCYPKENFFKCYIFLDNKTLSASDCKNAYDRFLCLNERCISLNAVCNEKNDCGDESDEGPRCEYDILIQF